MDFPLDAEAAHFLGLVRACINTHWPPAVRVHASAAAAPLRPGSLSSAQKGWLEALTARGWLAPEWPPEHGGCSWSPLQLYLWNRETAKAGCPSSPDANHLLARILWIWGTNEQQLRLLPALRQMQICCCQGEPEYEHTDSTGLMAPQLSETVAIPCGDHYLVNGCKNRVRDALGADWMLCLVPISATRRQGARGASLLLIDMQSPGISIMPMVSADNSLCTVTLQDVRVPAADLIGVPGEGGIYLANARALELRVGRAGGRLRAEFERLQGLAGLMPQDGGSVADDPGFHRCVSELETELLTLEALEWRTIESAPYRVAPRLHPIVMLREIEIARKIAALQVSALGIYALPAPDPLTLDNEGPIGPQAIVNAEKCLLWQDGAVPVHVDAHKNHIAALVLA